MPETFTQTPPWIWWLLLTIFLVIIEIFAPSFILVWFALGAGVALVAALIPGIELSIQIAVFGLASVAGLFLLRPYLRARNDLKEDGREINNFEVNLVGSTGILTEAIEGGKGRARIGDTTWTVTGPNLPIDTRIRVTSVDGIKLGVSADDAL